jgi:hypothetical protein
MTGMVNDYFNSLYARDDHLNPQEIIVGHNVSAIKP